MRNFKQAAVVAAFLLVVLCGNEVLLQALKPCTYFRNDMYLARTEEYEDIFVGTSHGKAGIQPDIIEEVTGRKCLNLCLGGEYPMDSYFIVKELCRSKSPKRVIYELDPGYWVTEPSLGPDYATVYEELPWSRVKLEYFNAKMKDVDFRITLFPWYVYRQGYKNVRTNLHTRLSKAYREHEGSIYASEREYYGKGGAVNIRRTDAAKGEEGLNLWEEQKLKSDSVEYFDKLTELCREKEIELIVITTPIPEETLEKYKRNFENADRFFTEYMEEKGITYYNFNQPEMRMENFDYSVDGFADYEGHMYEDQAEIFSRELSGLMK